MCVARAHADDRGEQWQWEEASTRQHNDHMTRDGCLVLTRLAESKLMHKGEDVGAARSGSFTEERSQRKGVHFKEKEEWVLGGAHLIGLSVAQESLQRQRLPVPAQSPRGARNMAAQLPTAVILF